MITPDRRRNRGTPPDPTTTIVRALYDRAGEKREVVAVQLKGFKSRSHLRYMEIRWLDADGKLRAAAAPTFERWARDARVLARRICMTQEKA